MIFVNPTDGQLPILPEGYMYVYRMENSDGQGPFKYPESREADKARWEVMDYLINALREVTRGLPWPQFDGIKHMDKEKDLCGCKSPEQMMLWMKGLHNQLVWSGFPMSIYKVPINVVKMGNHQVLFERDNAELIIRTDYPRMAYKSGKELEVKCTGHWDKNPLPPFHKDYEKDSCSCTRSPLPWQDPRQRYIRDKKGRQTPLVYYKECWCDCPNCIRSWTPENRKRYSEGLRPDKVIDFTELDKAGEEAFALDLSQYSYS